MVVTRCEGSRPGQNRAKFQRRHVFGDGGLGRDIPLTFVRPLTLWVRRRGARVNVIYCRYSCELQRPDSIKDQVRRCREALERMGIPHESFIVLVDEAIEGSLDSRPAFDKLKQLVYSDQLGILISTEQSRVSRGDNAKAFIKDVVFHGGRFITISEGIDTTRKGWKMIVGISEIHHSHSNDDTAERVRGAQEGRVRDHNGSAGDFPYGYASEFEDPSAAAAYCGRGPKPKRKVLIASAAASVVQEIFNRFAIQNESISAIVRWWEQHKDEFPKIGSSRIHHEHVRRMLTNKKYIGIWTFGATMTLYDGKGKKKQVPASPDQIVTVQRPDLRIVEQDLWDKAQARLSQLKAVYGMKPDGKKRGPSQYYRLLYEKSLLGGLVTCGSCGARLIVQRGGVKRLACPNHRVGKCPMAAGVNYDDAEQAVVNLLANILTSYPEWLQQAADATGDRLEQLARAVPDDLAHAQGQLHETSSQLDRLVDTLASGVDSPTIRSRVTQLETQKSCLESKVKQLERVRAAQVQMPEASWIRDQLDTMADLLTQEMSSFAASLRPLIGRIIAESVLAPGKTRGYVRLRVTLDGWSTLSHVLGAKLPASMLANLKPADDARNQEFVLDLGAPTKMDHWGPQIVQWRQQKMKWEEICSRTGLKPANASIAYHRCKRSNPTA